MNGAMATRARVMLVLIGALLVAVAEAQDLSSVSIIALIERDCVHPGPARHCRFSAGALADQLVRPGDTALPLPPCPS